MSNLQTRKSKEKEVKYVYLYWLGPGGRKKYYRKDETDPKPMPVPADLVQQIKRTATNGKDLKIEKITE